MTSLGIRPKEGLLYCCEFSDLPFLLSQLSRKRIFQRREA